MIEKTPARPTLVSGMMLLISKPIRQGDVIAFEKGFDGASCRGDKWKKAD